MEVSTMDNLAIMKLMVMELIVGAMENTIKDNG